MFQIQVFYINLICWWKIVIMLGVYIWALILRYLCQNCIVRLKAWSKLKIIFHMSILTMTDNYTNVRSCNDQGWECPGRRKNTRPPIPPPYPRGLAGNQGAEPTLTGLSRRIHELSNICHVTWIWIASNKWQMKRNTIERNKTRGL